MSDSCWVQLVKWEALLFFFALYDSNLNILDFWTIDSQQVSTVSTKLGRAQYETTGQERLVDLLKENMVERLCITNNQIQSPTKMETKTNRFPRRKKWTRRKNCVLSHHSLSSDCTVSAKAPTKKREKARRLQHQIWLIRFKYAQYRVSNQTQDSQSQGYCSACKHILSFPT